MSIRRQLAMLVTALLVASVVAVAGAPGAGALASYTVTSEVDGAPGSLRDILNQANADGDDSEIDLPAGAMLDLTLCESDEDGNASGDLDSTDGAHDLTINGNGATIRQTCDGQRVFHALNAGSLVTFRQVTITGGRATGNGGGIFMSGAGSLSVVLSTVMGNEASNVGGGIAASDGVDFVQVFVADSTISDNTAGGASGGGLFTLGSNTIVNSTFSGNEAGRDQGAIVGTSDLTYVTIYGNGVRSAGGGSQIDTGTISAFATVIAGGYGSSSNCIVGTTISGGFNVDDDGSCGFTEPTDQTVADVMLGALAANGGPTMTHLPQPGSPLLDTVTAVPCNPTYVADQRNVSRPQGSACDTGSVEVVVDTPPTTDTTSTSTTSSTTPSGAAAATPRYTG